MAETAANWVAAGCREADVTPETGFHEEIWIDSSRCFAMKVLHIVDGEGPEHHAVANRLNGIFWRQILQQKDPTALYADTILLWVFKVQYRIGSWL